MRQPQRLFSSSFLQNDRHLRDKNISYKYLVNAVGIGLLVENDNPQNPYPACRRYAIFVTDVTSTTPSLS